MTSLFSVVPPTSDDANILIWVILLTAAALGIAVSLFMRSKNKEK